MLEAFDLTAVLDVVNMYRTNVGTCIGLMWGSSGNSREVHSRSSVDGATGKFCSRQTGRCEVSHPACSCSLLHVLVMPLSCCEELGVSLDSFVLHNVLYGHAGVTLWRCPSRPWSFWGQTPWKLRVFLRSKPLVATN